MNQQSEKSKYVSIERLNDMDISKVKQLSIDSELELDCPWCITHYEDKFLIGEWDGGRLHLINRDGKVIHSTNKYNQQNQVCGPIACQVSKEGRIMVFDSNLNQIQIFDESLNVQSHFEVKNECVREFAINHQTEQLYLTDEKEQKLIILDSTGQLIKQIDSVQYCGLAFNSQGDLYTAIISPQHSIARLDERFEIIFQTKPKDLEDYYYLAFDSSDTLIGSSFTRGTIEWFSADCQLIGSLKGGERFRGTAAISVSQLDGEIAFCDYWNGQAFHTDFPPLFL